MAVVTPDGIVGKVVEAYPTASLVMLITDPTFAAGVVSQKNHVRGTLKGPGPQRVPGRLCSERGKVDAGEWFLHVRRRPHFPQGLSGRPSERGPQRKDVQGDLHKPQRHAGRAGRSFDCAAGRAPADSGWRDRVARLQDLAAARLRMSPEAAPSQPASQRPSVTDADRLREQYKQAGERRITCLARACRAQNRRISRKCQAFGARAAAAQSDPGASKTHRTARGASTRNRPAMPSGSSQADGRQRRLRPATRRPPPPKPKPRPTAPILVTDPTDADPDVAT